ncbi:MAG: hypothetical protein QM743_09250 [Chitinophagaceae bacterium]
MKQVTLLCGLAALSFSGMAQQVQHINQFGVSVFEGSHTLKPAHRADAGTRAKLLAAFPGWYIGTDRWTGGFTELNGPAVSIPGSGLEEKARTAMRSKLSVVGLNEAEWKLVDTRTNTKGFTILSFMQEVDGHTVSFAKMHVRFNADQKLARISMKSYGVPDLSLSPSVTEATALAKAIAGMETADITSQNIEGDWQWFPIPSAEGYQLHPAYKFTLTGKTEQGGSVPLNAYGYVDATNGDLLYRDNEVKDATDLQVVGRVYDKGFTLPSSLKGLPYIKADIGVPTMLLANDTGLLTSTTPTSPTTFQVSLSGKWSNVISVPDAKTTPTFTSVVSTSGSIDSFPVSSIATSRHINAYYHVNTVHDFMKSLYGTTFTGMDYALTTNVDATGICNAFFTGTGGSSINFYPAGGGCVSFAEVRDVVYHEYGHGIVNKLYTSGMTNGGLNEGQADVWALSITKDSVLARGATIGAPTSFIRRYDGTPKVFPVNLTGEVHDNGEIIAGAWWDYGKNVGSVDSMSKLFALTLADQPDGPNGTEGDVYFEMLIDALVNDDNDGDLSNGTPHFLPLVKAFARHGIYLLQDADLTHTELGHQAKGASITFNATLTVSHPEFFSGLDLVYRTSRATGAAWDTVSMTDLGAMNFTATIPGQDAGTLVDYYFAAEDIVNQTGIFFPANFYPPAILAESQSNIPYQFGVGLTVSKIFDFETDPGSDWRIGIATDNATSGKWVRAVPISSKVSGNIVQTGNDHTSGTGSCLVTANATSTWASASSASVKNGVTTVTTPLFDISSYTTPVIEYYRWYGNDRGQFPKRDRLARKPVCRFSIFGSRGKHEPA